MLRDALLLFEPDGTAITVSADSTNTLDMSQGRDMGVNPEQGLDIFIVIIAAFAAVGAATLVVSIQGAVDNAGAPGTYYDFIMTGILPVANLTAGRAILRTGLPRRQPCASNVNTPPRYYKLRYTVATGPMTAGTVDAGLIPSHGRQDDYSYPAGVAVSN